MMVKSAERVVAQTRLALPDEPTRTQLPESLSPAAIPTSGTGPYERESIAALAMAVA